MTRERSEQGRLLSEAKMTQWEELDLEAKVTAILAEVHYPRPHHFGRPFLTAYQLALAVAARYPQDVEAMGLPIGGEGTGQQTSLGQYLAARLSERIQRAHITHIDGAFLSNLHLEDLIFEGGVTSSMTKGRYGVSMFRLRDTLSAA